MIFSSAPDPNQVPRDSQPTPFVPQDKESQLLPLELDLELTGAHEPVVGILIVHRAVHHDPLLCYQSQPTATGLPTHTICRLGRGVSGPTIGIWLPLGF